MKKWILKAIVQKTISFFPYSNKINFLLQKYITKGVKLDDIHFGYKFGHLVDHVNFYLEESGEQDLKNKKCLELGTGWYPVIPFGYFLKGAQKTYSIDISPLLTSKTFFLCLNEILAREDQFILHLGNDIKERFQALKKIHSLYNENTPIETLCNYINLELIVTDARQLNIKKSSISLVSSNNTFEHIYPAVLKGVLLELWSVVKENGIMSHFIDMSDHFAHMDQSISIYNFLKYSEKQWLLIDNSIQPQNRWRLSQFKELYDELRIPFIENKIRLGDREVVKSLQLDEFYNNFSVDDIAISHGYLISMKKQGVDHTT